MKKAYLIDFIGFMIAKAKNISHLFSMAYVNSGNRCGSGSIWSAHFAAMMLSVLQTIVLWGLNPHHWLSAFLQACAESGGQSPADLSPFVPWQMSAERRDMLSRPLPARGPALGGLAQEQPEPEAANTS